MGTYCLERVVIKMEGSTNQFSFVICAGSGTSRFSTLDLTKGISCARLQTNLQTMTGWEITVRELEEVWVKIENYHGEMVLKRRKKKGGDKSDKYKTNTGVYVRGNNQLHKCKMRNIWCDSSYTEDKCNLSKSQKCPAAVKTPRWHE